MSIVKKPLNSSTVCWITLTNGRQNIINQSRKSWYEKLSGNITKEIIVDDSGNEPYRAWLREQFPSATVIPVGENNMGYTKAMAKCFEIAIESGCEFVFHTEDDFILNEHVDLNDLAHILITKPYMSQIILQRQRWYPEEFIEDTYMKSIKHAGVHIQPVEIDGLHYLEQSNWWSANPNLYPIKVAQLGWGDEGDSERKFSDKVMSRGYKSGWYGTEDKDQCVTHIGYYRLGDGH